jgi:hypothetical protein
MLSSLHQAAKALGGEVTGQQVLCPGPGHSRKDRSLAVRFDPTAPEGFIVFSHADDDPITCRDYVRERLGMDPFEPGRSNGATHKINGQARLHEEDPPKPAAQIIPPESNSAAIPVLHDELRRHVYLTAEGVEAVVKIKKAGGKFTQWFNVGGRWQPEKPKGVSWPALPYTTKNLNPFDPELAGDELYWPEGEKDVETLDKLNVPAFTFGGVTDSLPDDLGPYVRGRRIVVLADNDREQQGIKHAQKKVERAAIAGAAAIKIVSFVEKDVSDFVATGRGAEDLQQHCGAIEWSEQEASATDEAGDTDQLSATGEKTSDAQATLAPTLFVLRPADAIAPRPRLYGSHFIRKFVSSTMGRTGVGKTDFLIADMLSMTTAKLLLDHAPTEPLRIWYIGEDPVDEMERRIVAACQYYGITAADIGDRLHIDSALVLNDLKIARPAPRGGTVIDTDVQDGLMAAITRRKIDIAILDPLIKFHLVNESNPTEMDFVMRGICEIADKTSIAIDLGHHLRKPGIGNTGPATMDDGRGASSIISAARSVRMLNGMSSAEATKAAIAEPDRWRYLRVDSAPLGKANMSPPQATRWLQHLSEMLPCGESIGVIASWKFPDAMEGVTAADMYKARDLARGGSYRADERAKEWFGRAVADHLHLEIDNPADKQKVKALIKVWMRNKALDIENREDPVRRKKFDFVIPGPFSDGPSNNVVHGSWTPSDDNQEF